MRPRRAATAALTTVLTALPLASHAFDPLALVAEPITEERKRALAGLKLEAWHQQFDWRSRPPGAPGSQQRLLLDLRREWTLGGGGTAFGAQPIARVNLSNRLEWVHNDRGSETRHTLRELFVSTQATDALFLDAGRINWRNGVGYGFNPTDFLGRGTAVDQASLDPRAQRENRLGTVMLRTQYYAEAGSAALALVPSLSAQGSSNPRSPAWQRSNPKRAALLKVAPATSERTSVDLLGYWQEGERPQAGLNLTWLANDAMVLHLELARASHADSSRRNAVAAGATWTSRAGPQLTVEWLRDPRNGSRALFSRIAWNRAFDSPELTLAGFARYELDSRQRSAQLEMSWNLDARHSVSLIAGYIGEHRAADATAPLRQYATASFIRHF
ncbi:MAG: hypothetical protein ACK4KV_05990 [Rhodocyclaceae bacterium]